MNRRLNPIPVAKMRGTRVRKAASKDILLIFRSPGPSPGLWLFFPLDLADLSPRFQGAIHRRNGKMDLSAERALLDRLSLLVPSSSTGRVKTTTRMFVTQTNTNVCAFALTTRVTPLSHWSCSPISLSSFIGCLGQHASKPN